VIKEYIPSIEDLNIPYYCLLEFYRENPLIVIVDFNLEKLFKMFPDITYNFKDKFLKLSHKERLEFIDFIDSLITWAKDFLGITLPSPEEQQKINY